MRPDTKVALTPLQRKAEFAKATTLKKKGVSAASKEDLDSSWTHLRECFEEERTPSRDLATRVAAYVEMEPDEFWGAEIMAQVR